VLELRSVLAVLSGDHFIAPAAAVMQPGALLAQKAAARGEILQSEVRRQCNAFALSAIVAGCWRTPETFRTAGVAAAYVTLVRPSTCAARLHSRAGIGLGTTIEYPQRTTTQLQEHCATRNERCREQRTGLDQISATHNERRRGQRLKSMLGITHVPLHYKRLV
jgi:hypothetical protein